MKYLLKPVVSVALWTLTGGLHSAWAGTCDDAFQEAKQSYFSSLNYNVASVADAIPEVENRLLSLTSCVTDTGSPDVGMPQIYAALYMKNAVQGVENGKVSYETLTRYRKFAPDGDVTAEIRARLHFAVELFRTARGLRPDDRRVPGWLAAAELVSDYQDNGVVSESLFQNLLQTILAYPEFNLFTAYLAIQDLPLDDSQKETIYGETRKMASLSGACSPIKPSVDPACKNLSFAPFSAQTGFVQMGDVLLKRAQELSRDGFFKNLSEIFENRGIAWAMYSYNFLPMELPTTLKWPNGSVLIKRLEMAGTLGPESGGSYWTKAKARQPYQCASCHSPH